MLRQLRKGIDILLHLLFPPACTFCGALLEREEEAESICPACRRSLPRTSPMSFRMVGACECRFPLWYVGVVRQSLLRYKFEYCAFYSRIYGPLLRQCLSQWPEATPDVVTWTPLSRAHLRKRGYDQAKLLAVEAARQYQLQPVPLLKKTRNTRTQSRLTAEQRLKNAKNVYVCTDPAAVQGRRVLLVDDIVTTGATLDNCAKALLAAGAAQVCCLTLAGSVKM